MAHFDPKKALNKEMWSGEDAGQAYISALVAQLDKSLPVIPGATIIERTKKLDPIQFKIYRQYMWVYDWLSYEFALAQATIFHAKSAALELLEMLTDVDRAHKERNSTLRVPFVFDHNKQTMVECQHARKILSQNLTLSPEDVLDLIIIFSSGKVANREWLNQFNEDFYKGKPIPKDLQSNPNPDTEELKDLEALKSAVKEEAEGIGQRISRKRVQQVAISLQAKMNSEKPKSSGLSSIKGYSELRERAAAASKRGEYSFKTLFYSDFCGFWGLLLAAGNPLKKSPRHGTADGFICMTDGIPTDDDVNIIIHSNGTITDKKATPELLEQLKRNGLLRFSPKDSRRELYAQKYKDLMIDIEATNQYNALIDAAARRTGVDEMKLYKREFGQITPAAGKYNLVLADIRENSAGFVPEPGIEPEASTPRNLYIYSNKREQAESRDIANNFLMPIEINQTRQYSQAVINRIDEAFKDMKIFSGGSSKIYELFAEGADD